MGLQALTSADRAAGLRDGDKIAFPAMDVPARAASAFHYSPTQAGRAGDTVVLVLERGAQRLRVPYFLRRPGQTTVFAAQLGFKVTLIAIASLLLWRGRDRASVVLGLWCTGVGIALPDAWWGILPLSARIAGGALTAVCWTTSPFLLYLVVESIATGVSLWEKLSARVIMVALMLPALVLNSVDAVSQVLSGCWAIPVAPWFANAAFAASQCVIVAFFALSYVRTSGLAKQRIRWIFWAFLISRVGVLLNLLNRLLPHPMSLSGFEWASVLVFRIGCTYAILRHRVIDVNFVLNRALVYSILTSVVVGVFILVEDLLQTFAAGRGIGIAVEVSVALALGFSFNALHKQVERAIERALFRAKHEAANMLRRLSEEASFMESSDALLRRAVTEVHACTGAATAAIYERNGQGYARSIWCGQEPPPDVIDCDDLAFVRLRKTRTYADLGDVPSALGSDGIVFAFTVRGQLGGALLCRRRPNGEAYAPDEIALLSAVAHEVGAEVHAIRARQQMDLLDALLSGSLDVREARARSARGDSGLTISSS
jgi:hypothetical protein